MESPSRKSDLEAFLEDIVRATGVELCLFDFKYFTKDALELNVPSERRIHACQYCRLVKSRKEAWKRCIDTEYWRAEKAASMTEPFMHTCHAGVTDLVVPLKVGNRLIGALYLGQVACQEEAQLERAISELARNFGITEGELAAAGRQLPRMAPAALSRLGPILQCARRFVEQAVELSEYRHPNSSDGVEPASIGDVPIYFLDTLHPVSETVRRALRFIRTGYWQEINQPMVARKVGLSASQFSRLFHAETGMTFRECLMQVRLEAAGYLLKRSNLKVYQIAEMVGYQNNTSMQRAFRRIKGFTPLTFIRRQGETKSSVRIKGCSTPQ